MGEASLAAELTLGSPSFHGSFKPKNTGKFSRTELYLQSLEEELKKIEVFKRELPLCMKLLSNEIEASREKLCGCRQNEACTQRAESLSRNGTPDPSAHKMSSTIFCSQLNKMGRSSNHLIFDPVHPNVRPASTLSSNTSVEADVDAARETDEMVSAMANTLYRTKAIGRCDNMQVCGDEMFGMPSLSMNWPRLGGAFEPFLKNKWRTASDEASMEASTPPHDDHHQYGVFSPGVEKVETNSLLGGEEAILKPMQGKEYNLATMSAGAGISTSPSQNRKPRRSWSSELHRKFVNALQQLGGAEVATPKQIRELMQVDGLTNDEVKSHLQKYRLHTKRPILSSLQQTATHAAAIPAVPTPQLVVLGGIWVPQDYTQLTQNQVQEPNLYMSHHYLQAEQKLQLFPP